MAEVKNPGGISDDAVKAATGKTWPQWCAVLDKQGAAKLDHKGIVAIVAGGFGIGPWWQQMVTVGYEQARGLREKHEKVSGFSVSASRTFPVAAAIVFKAWTDARKRRRWLPDPLTIRKATPDRSVRIVWGDGKTKVDVMFYPKGDAKTQMSVQHDKLKDAKAAKKMKQFWAAAMERLKATLE